MVAPAHSTSGNNDAFSTKIKIRNANKNEGKMSSYLICSKDYFPRSTMCIWICDTVLLSGLYFDDIGISLRAVFVPRWFRVGTVPHILIVLTVNSLIDRYR